MKSSFPQFLSEYLCFVRRNQPVFRNGECGVRRRFPDPVRPAASWGYDLDNQVGRTPDSLFSNTSPVIPLHHHDVRLRDVMLAQMGVEGCVIYPPCIHLHHILTNPENELERNALMWLGRRGRHEYLSSKNFR